MIPANPQYRQPPTLWSRYLTDEVDWVAQIWDWQRANQLTGQLLSFFLPLEAWVDRQPVKGPVLIAGKKQEEGPDRTILLTTMDELSPARLNAARLLVPESSPTPIPEGSIEVCLLRDLAAFGATELIELDTANGRTHPLGDAQEF